LFGLLSQRNFQIKSFTFFLYFSFLRVQYRH
jgi:hypothetical protein